MTSKGALIISTAGRDGNELSLLAGRVALDRWTNPGFYGSRYRHEGQLRLTRVAGSIDDQGEPAGASPGRLILTHCGIGP